MHPAQLVGVLVTTKEELFEQMRQQQCEVCDKEPIKGVAAIPFIPMSVGYGQECLSANAHPWFALVANQACIGDSLETTHPQWQQMVHDTIAHLGGEYTMEKFEADVAESIRQEEEQFQEMMNREEIAGSIPHVEGFDAGAVQRSPGPEVPQEERRQGDGQAGPDHP